MFFPFLLLWTSPQSVPLTDKLKTNDNNHDIPQNATIRQEYIRCGNPDCEN